jgi:hypothetical protein
MRLARRHLREMAIMLMNNKGKVVATGGLEPPTPAL